MTATSRPLVCGSQVLLPLALIVGALDMETVAGVAELTDVDSAPTCTMQLDHADGHHGVVLDLDGATTGAVWAVWADYGAPHLVVLPDCPGRGDQACGSYAAHPGGHSWQLHDPLLAAVRQAVAEMRDLPSC